MKKILFAFILMCFFLPNCSKPDKPIANIHGLNELSNCREGTLGDWYSNSTFVGVLNTNSVSETVDSICIEQSNLITINGQFVDSCIEYGLAEDFGIEREDLEKIHELILDRNLERQVSPLIVSVHGEDKCALILNNHPYHFIIQKADLSIWMVPISTITFDAVTSNPTIVQ